nr:MAG TPA: hypothetical protein [Caudoviricetes sp.]
MIPFNTNIHLTTDNHLRSQKQREEVEAAFDAL